MRNDDRDKFVNRLVQDVEKWTGIDDPHLHEAMRDFTGAMYTEMRKMTRRICACLERNNVPESVKREIKEEIGDTWYNINSRQKVGATKLSMVISNHVNQK